MIRKKVFQILLSTGSRTGFKRCALLSGDFLFQIAVSDKNWIKRRSSWATLESNG